LIKRIYSVLYNGIGYVCTDFRFSVASDLLKVRKWRSRTMRESRSNPRKIQRNVIFIFIWHSSRRVTSYYTVSQKIDPTLKRYSSKL